MPDLKYWQLNAFCIGNNIVDFNKFRTGTYTYLYNVLDEKWSSIKLKYTKNLFF